MTFGGDTDGSSSAASLLSRDLFGKTVHLNNDIIKTNMHNLSIHYISTYKERKRKKEIEKSIETKIIETYQYTKELYYYYRCIKCILMHECINALCTLVDVVNNTRFYR